MCGALSLCQCGAWNFTVWFRKHRAHALAGRAHDKGERSLGQGFASHAARSMVLIAHTDDERGSTGSSAHASHQTGNHLMQAPPRRSHCALVLCMCVTVQAVGAEAGASVAPSTAAAPRTIYVAEHGGFIFTQADEDVAMLALADVIRDNRKLPSMHDASFFPGVEGSDGTCTRSGPRLRMSVTVKQALAAVGATDTSVIIVEWRTAGASCGGARAH